jgi:dihydroorotase
VIRSESSPEIFAICDVDVWNAQGIETARDVWVRDGRIEAIVPAGARARPERVVEGGGRVLMPSGVDAQVHLRVPGQPQKELPETGLRAALRGGVGAFLTMPNTKPVIDSVEVLERARREVADAEARTGVRVLFSAAMTLGQDGLIPVNGASLAAAGAKAFTDDGKGVARLDVMREVFRVGEATGLPLLQHAEIPGHGAALAPGPTQERLGLRPYPEEAEWKMVERDLSLLADFPRARYHVLHISSARTVELLAAARERGLQATGETSPHHLLLTSSDIPPDNTAYKMNPPLRGPTDREVLRAALADGRLAFVATDHAPHEPEMKGADFSASAFGTTGLEALLRVLILLRKQGLLTAERLVEVFAAAPARFLGVDDEFGLVAEGRPLRAALVDVDAAPNPVRVEELESLSKNSCFLGLALPGKIVAHFNGAGIFLFD